MKIEYQGHGVKVKVTGEQVNTDIQRRSAQWQREEFSLGGGPVNMEATGLW